MAYNLLYQIAVAIVLAFVSYALMPKPKTESRQGQKLRQPTAEAGVPWIVAWGEISILEPNTLFYGDISQHDYEVRV